MEKITYKGSDWHRMQVPNAGEEEDVRVQERQVVTPF